MGLFKALGAASSLLLYCVPARLCGPLGLGLMLLYKIITTARHNIYTLHICYFDCPVPNLSKTVFLQICQLSCNFKFLLSFHSQIFTWNVNYINFYEIKVLLLFCSSAAYSFEILELLLSNPPPPLSFWIFASHTHFAQRLVISQKYFEYWP